MLATMPMTTEDARPAALPHVQVLPKQWQGPYRLACVLPEAGKVEYRIDHLVQSDLGVEVRKAERPAEKPSPHPHRGRRVAHPGELTQSHLREAPAFRKPGEWWDP